MKLYKMCVCVGGEQNSEVAIPKNIWMLRPVSWNFEAKVALYFKKVTVTYLRIS